MVIAALVAGIGVSTWEMIRATHAERQQNQLRQVAVKALNGEKEQRAQAESERERANTQARKALESQEQSRRLLYASDMNLAQQALKLNNVGKARRLLERHRPKPGEPDLRGWEWRYLWQLTRSSALATLMTLIPAGSLFFGKRKVKANGMFEIYPFRRMTLR
jgi:hypothetical protein